ncbi:FG-GAP repeat domain-containing protein [Streptomyces hydrogenans]|uniref:FG-GAP repeat domain-containing protein n=1 Tax=Streptomyces hydrogenans TaxID=1873719 RepID=UPI00382FF4B4
MPRTTHPARATRAARTSSATTAPRFLTAAVTVALAVTGGALTIPASAAVPAAVTAADAPQDVTRIRPGGTVVGGGPSGFLTRYSADGVFSYAWTRYADGSTTLLPSSRPYVQTGRTDLLTQGEGTVRTVRDMGTGSEPVATDLAHLAPGYTSGVASGPSSFVTVWADPEGGEELHIVTRTATGLRAEKVTGFPEGADFTSVAIDSPHTALVRYVDAADTTAVSHLAVVDIERRASVDDVTPAHATSGIAVSPTHLAWVETPANFTTATVVVMPRGATPDDALRIPLRMAAGLRVALIDGWVLYGQGGAHEAYRTNPLYGLTARSLTDERSVKVLDTFDRAVPGPGGTMLAQGGTLAGGEGVYRILLGADGVPAAEQVASDGRPTALTYLSDDVPEVIDLDQEKSADFSWLLSNRQALTVVKATHVATGRTLTWSPSTRGLSDAERYTWNGALSDYMPESGVPAPNGTYTWHLTATPANGIGPAVEKSGTFTVKRAPVPHDYDDNGVPDLVHREYDNSLVAHNPITPLGAYNTSYTQPLSLGTGGWQIYDRIVATGDLAGPPHSDLLARDRAGVLWLYQGTGKGLTRRVQVGGGWQVYDKLTSAADLTGDNHIDLLAADKAGVLWLYKGTGSASAPFAKRTKVGSGWGVYNGLAAVGNVAGAAAGDLVARDRAGVLWLYLGKGDGTFTARTRIGGGWQVYDHVFGFGDVDRDGYADLVGVAEAPNKPYVYRGTGLRTTPFTARQPLYNDAYFSLDLY